MTLQAHALDLAASAVLPDGFDPGFADSPAARECRGGETLVRFTPKYADAARDVRVHWRLEGAANAPVVVVQGGISADRNALPGENIEGWWHGIAGDGRAIDTRCCRVLSIDWIECRDLGDALAVDTRDQAAALAALLDALGIERIHAYVGSSYGAMVGLAFAATHPQRVTRLVAIAGAHRAHPLSIALRNIQREIVRLGARGGDRAAGLALARRLAMTTYRSEREFAERCSGDPVFADGRFHFAEEPWLCASGARFVERFDGERYLALSESIDLHAVAPESIRVPTTLVGISSDRVVPLADLCELQRRCGASATLHVIESRYGHDGFLKEDAQIGAILVEALALAGGAR